MLLFVVRALTPSGCDRRRQRVPISKAEFSSQASGGMPSAPSPADPVPAGNGSSDNGGHSISRLVLVAEAEIGVIDPHAMKDDPDLTSERDLGAFGAAAFGDGDGPGFEFRPSCDAGHQHVGGFEERDPHRGISGAADGAGSVSLAGLIAPWRQAKARPDCLGGGEAFRSVDGGAEG